MFNATFSSFEDNQKKINATEIVGKLLENEMKELEKKITEKEKLELNKKNVYMGTVS